jgi:zinc protease
MRSPPSLAALGIGCALLVALHRGAAGPTPPATAEPEASDVPALEYEKYRLANGLEVILHQDSSLPLVAVNLWYHVGPAHEPAGRSGFAHLMEHLMFEGSQHVGKRFDALLESAGATNANGTTSWDRTNYFETVPREYLELVLWLESDRMGFLLPAVTPERFRMQRRVVQNERRESYDNAPYGPSTLKLFNTLFPRGHPYHGAIIGSMADLSAATLQDVHDFFRSFYAPGNATLAIVGDFQPNTAKRLVQRYFGPVPAGKVVARRRPGTAPPRSPRRVVVAEPVKLARVRMGWISPPAYSQDELPLDLASLILAGGKATRLYRALVVEQQLASEVNAYLDANELCSIAVVDALVSHGRSAEAVEQALDAVLAELGRSGPTRDELERAKRHRLVDVLSELQLLNGADGESGRAGLLQRFNHYLGNPGYLPSYVHRLRQVSVSDVRHAVATHLGRRGRVVVVTQPRSDSSSVSSE